MGQAIPEIQQWFPWNGSKRSILDRISPVINRWTGKGWGQLKENNMNRQITLKIEAFGEVKNVMEWANDS